MAGLTEYRGVWLVTWRDAGKQRRKQVRTRDDALAFMAANGMKHEPRGRRSRSRQQIIHDLAANFEVSEDGCWLWTGKLAPEGYAQATWSQNGASIPGGHRVMLHAIGQPVPRELVVDHLCRVRRCVNPDHLDVVVQRENVMRSPVALGALNAAKTHCAKDHPYSDENTYVYASKKRSTTSRICKTCAHDYYLRRQERRRGLTDSRELVAS